MTREAMRALPGEPLVKEYTDRQGVKRCVGLKEKLKSSQYMGPNLAMIFLKRQATPIFGHVTPSCPCPFGTCQIMWLKECNIIGSTMLYLPPINFCL